MSTPVKSTKFGLRHLPKYRGNTCMNCGHPLELSHRYCPQCSQLNSTKHLTVRDFIEEFLGSIIDYDSRLFRTVKAMLFRPGQISNDYLSGKRVTYTNPFRFLLSLAIIYFLLQQLMGNYQAWDTWEPEENLKEVTGSLPERGPKISNSTSANESKPSDFKTFEFQMREKGKLHDSLILAEPKKCLEAISGGRLSRYLQKTSSYLVLIREHELKKYEEAVARYQLRPSREDQFSFESAQSLWRLYQEPGSFMNQVLSRLPLVTFFFLPLFSLFPWLMYIRKKYTFTDNLVFGFHMQSLFFILLLLGLIAEWLTGTDCTLYAVTAFSIYLYAAMRRFYQQGTFKTIIKYLLLNAVFTILGIFVVLLYIVGTAITY